MAEARVGIDLGPGSVAAVMLGHDGDTIARATAPDLPGALARLDGTRPGFAMVDAGRLAAEALEGGSLRRVAVVRIGAPLTLAVPPLVTWPTPLRRRISAGTAVVRGGAEAHGGEPRLDEDALARFLAGAEAEAVAVTGMFAPAVPDEELASAEVVRRVLGPHVPVVLSHEIGGFGLVERENATVLCAALTGALDGLAATLRSALGDAAVYLTRGDGTLISLAHAQRLPVTLIGSGRASAMQGAFRLTGIDDAVVALTEGSAVAVGVLRTGVPWMSSRPALVAGVQVGLRLADTRLVADADALGRAVGLLAGPHAVLVAVGRVSAVVADGLDGVDELIRPADGELARAFGAALAVVGGHAERICADRPEARRAALEEARAAACERAIQMGARPAGVTVVGVEEAPLASVPERSLLLCVRAAGPPETR